MKHFFSVAMLMAIASVSFSQANIEKPDGGSTTFRHSIGKPTPPPLLTVGCSVRIEGDSFYLVSSQQKEFYDKLLDNLRTRHTKDLTGRVLTQYSQSVEEQKRLFSEMRETQDEYVNLVSGFFSESDQRHEEDMQLSQQIIEAVERIEVQVNQEARAQTKKEKRQAFWKGVRKGSVKIGIGAVFGYWVSTKT